MCFCSCGPIFGAGADLLIAHNCNTTKDSYSNLPHSYDGPNASTESLFGDYNFTVTDYEVYTLMLSNTNNNGNNNGSNNGNSTVGAKTN